MNVLLLFNKKLLIKKNCYAHDIYITITNSDNIIYDCVLEYFEKKSHNDKIDKDKEIQTEQFVDIYKIYDERRNYTMGQFMKDTIYDLLMLICTASDDCYSLAKINYFKSLESNTNEKHLTQYFEYLIECKKINKFNFIDFHNRINPINPDNGEYISKDEFIKIINKNYKLNCILDNNYGTYDLLSNIIINIDCGQIESSVIKYIKKIFNCAINILFNSQQQMINFIKERNNKKNNIPEFIKVFCQFHLKNHVNEHVKKDVATSLYKYYQKTDEYKIKQN